MVLLLLQDFKVLHDHDTREVVFIGVAILKSLKDKI